MGQEHSVPLPSVLSHRMRPAFFPVMRCRTCGDPAGIRDVHATIGPSGGFQRSVPRVATRRRSAAGSAGPGLVPQTIELIGNRWSAAALAAALFGARRFTDVLTMTGAPPAIVADRLRTFCQMGVLTTVTPPGAGRAEYRLTDKGRAFFPHVMMMLEWGDRWFRAPEGPATLLTHTACGREFHPVLHCSACGYAAARHPRPRRSGHLGPDAARPARRACPPARPGPVNRGGPGELPSLQPPVQLVSPRIGRAGVDDRAVVVEALAARVVHQRLELHDAVGLVGVHDPLDPVDEQRRLVVLVPRGLHDARLASPRLDEAAVWKSLTIMSAIIQPVS